MKTLLILSSLLTFSVTTYTQVSSRPTGKAINDIERPRVVKTVSSRVVGARTFKASAYSLRGRTASGELVRQGIIAADPRVLPLGTRVYIEGMGNFIVKDTGGAIKGNRIDIWMPSTRNAMIFGRRTVQLRILK